MNFWDRFYSLCVENGTKPTPVAKQLGIAVGSVTKWKNGALPTLESAILIANHFNVSVGYLVGEPEQIVPSQPDDRWKRYEEQVSELPKSSQERLMKQLQAMIDIEKESHQS